MTLVAPSCPRERLGVCSATAADAGEMLAQGIERQPFVIVGMVKC